MPSKYYLEAISLFCSCFVKIKAASCQVALKDKLKMCELHLINAGIGKALGATALRDENRPLSQNTLISICILILFHFISLERQSHA